MSASLKVFNGDRDRVSSEIHYSILPIYGQFSLKSDLYATVRILAESAPDFSK